jgi:hypothetical protein
VWAGGLDADALRHRARDALAASRPGQPPAVEIVAREGLGVTTPGDLYADAGAT